MPEQPDISRAWWDIENAVDHAVDLAKATGLRHKVRVDVGSDFFGPHRFVIEAVHPPERVGEQLTSAGRLLRQVAAEGNDLVEPWKYVPCGRAHTPGRICILADGHNGRG